MRVTPEAARAIKQGHPWLFESAITQQSFAGQPGDLAVIFDKKRRFLAIGLFDPHSPIRVRILQAVNQSPSGENGSRIKSPLPVPCALAPRSPCPSTNDRLSAHPRGK